MISILRMKNLTGFFLRFSFLFFRSAQITLWPASLPLLSDYICKFGDKLECVLTYRNKNKNQNPLGTDEKSVCEFLCVLDEWREWKFFGVNRSVSSSKINWCWKCLCMSMACVCAYLFVYLWDAFALLLMLMLLLSPPLSLLLPPLMLCCFAGWLTGSDGSGVVGWNGMDGLATTP